MRQSLLTGWAEPAHIKNKQWVLDWYTRLNPTTAKICGSVDPVTGAWRFEFPDQVQARLPNTEIIYRPYAENENDQWKLMSAQAWVANAKARLEGRNYRVTFCCEPAPLPSEFPAFMRYSVELMEEADRQGLKVDMWGIPAQHLLMFTSDIRDIRKGLWTPALKVAGALRGTVQIDIHCYTGIVAPAGTYDDNYLREIMTDPDLLRYEDRWPTYEDIESRPYQTRHLFRDMWLNRYAQELGIPEHDVFLGETLFDYFGDEPDLRDTWARANAIAGDDLNVCVGERKVGGIRTLPNVTRWKFPHLTFKDAIVAQLRWHGQIRAKNPRIKGYALYMLSDKDGDQRPHNWLAHTDILDACVGLNPVDTAAPTPPPAKPPVEPPPVIIAPTVLCRARTLTTLNLRPSPSSTVPPITTIPLQSVLQVIAPDGAPQMLCKKDMWVQVITPAKMTGWVAAQYLALYEEAPAPKPTWRTQVSEATRARLTLAETWKARHTELPLADFAALLELATLLDAH